MSDAFAKCRSCNAPIIWAETVRGKLMPVDAEVNEAGSVQLTLTQSRGRNILTAFVGKDLGPDFERHTSHFVTCPNAAQHRRGK